MDHGSSVGESVERADFGAVPAFVRLPCTTVRCPDDEEEEEDPERVDGVKAFLVFLATSPQRASSARCRSYST